MHTKLKREDFFELEHKQSEFRKGGKLLFNFQQKTGTVNLVYIMIGTLLGGLIVRNSSILFGVNSNIGMPFALPAGIIIIQYGIFAVWPEFLLLTYCKFRFNSFIISMPVQSGRDQPILLESTTRKSIKYTLTRWWNKPLAAIKSRAGWRNLCIP